MKKTVKRVLIATLSVLMVLAVALLAAACLPVGYDISLDYDETQGSVTIDPDKTTYDAGEQVTVTISPFEGYELDAFTVNDASITLTDDTYAFTVEGDTFIQVTFKATEVTPEPEPEPEPATLPEDIRGTFTGTIPQIQHIEVYADHLESTVAYNVTTRAEAADVEVVKDEDGNTVSFSFEGANVVGPVTVTVINVDGNWRLQTSAGLDAACTFVPETATTALYAARPFALNEASPLADYEGTWVTPNGDLSVEISDDSVTIFGIPLTLGAEIDEDFEYYFGDGEFTISLYGIYIRIDDLSGSFFGGWLYFVPADSASFTVSTDNAGVWTSEGEEFTVQITDTGLIYINGGEPGFVVFAYEDGGYYMYYVFKGNTELYILTFSDGFGDIYNDTTGEYAYLENGGEPEPGPEPETGDPIPEEYQGDYRIVSDDEELGTVTLGADYVELHLGDVEGIVAITADDVDGVWDEANGVFYLSTITFEIGGNSYQISRSPYGTGLFIGIWTEFEGDEEHEPWADYVNIGSLENGENPNPGPDVPDTDPLPEVFVGAFTGEADGKTYTVTVISITDITLTIDGDSFAATDISFNANWDRLTFTANGTVWLFYPRDDGAYDVFRLSGGEVGLYVTREGYGEETPEWLGEEWWGTYTTDGVSAVKTIEITEDAIFVDGDNVTQFFTYNAAFGSGTIAFSEENFIVIRFHENGVISVDWVYFVKTGAVGVAIDPFFYGTWKAADGSTLVISEDSVALDGEFLFAYDQIGEGEDAVLYVVYNGNSYTIGRSYAANNALSFDFTPYVRQEGGEVTFESFQGDWLSENGTYHYYVSVYGDSVYFGLSETSVYPPQEPVEFTFNGTAIFFDYEGISYSLTWNADNTLTLTNLDYNTSVTLYRD